MNGPRADPRAHWVESLLRQAADFQPGVPPPADLCRRALAGSPRPPVPPGPAASPAPLAVLGLVLAAVAGGWMAAGLRRVPAAPGPAGSPAAIAVAAAPSRPQGWAVRRTAATPGTLRGAVPAPPARRRGSGHRRRARGAAAHWTFETVTRQFERVLTPVWLVEQDETDGMLTLTPAVLAGWRESPVCGPTADSPGPETTPEE